MHLVVSPREARDHLSFGLSDSGSARYRQIEGGGFVCDFDSWLAARGA